MSGLNLHGIANGIISGIHPNEALILARSTGETYTDDMGIVHNEYINLPLTGQVQNETESALFHANLAGQTTMVKRIYLHAPASLLTQIQGIFRPLSRTGDFIRRKDGTWWLVTSVLENYGGVGWICVRVTMQVNPPTGWEEDKGFKLNRCNC